MILGIGTDIVQVDRFKSWTKYPPERLLRVFSEQEIFDCSSNIERMASRFAAKESFYKALSSALIYLNFTQKPFSFLFACQNVEVVKDEWGVPKLKIDWQAFEEKISRKLPKLITQLSISHEKNLAISFVVISLG